MLRTRLLTAAIGIPVLIGVVWVGDVLLAAVVALAAAVASIEFAMARDAHKTPLAVSGALCAAALPAIALAGGQEYLLGGFVASIGLTLAVYTTSKDPHADLESWLWSAASALYFGGLGAYFVLLRDAIGVSPGWTAFPPVVDDGFGRDLVFFTLLTVWATDTGAYFVGRAIGKHKLAPAISPAKTIEGAFGSLFTGFAAVFVLNEVLDLGLAVEHRVALGLLLPPVIMVGDLAESALKRALGVKDSSGLVPGHGGIADRLDSLLFAAPAVYYYLKWIVL